MAEFSQGFTDQGQLVEQALVQSQSTMDAGQTQTNHWPETRTTLIDWFIPSLHRWMVQLRAAKRRIYLFPVDLQRHWLKRYSGVTWWYPNTFRLRYQSAYLRLQIRYYRVRNWLRSVWFTSLAWFKRNRRFLLNILAVVALFLATIVSCWLSFVVWQNILEYVLPFWESMFGP